MSTIGGNGMTHYWSGEVVDLEARRLARQGHPSEESAAAVEAGDLSGERDQNPPGMSLPALLAEDFRTHDSDATQLGFWALAVHRLGNWRMGVRPKTLRAPLSAAYKALYLGVTTATGIDLPYATKIGRRVRFWHHGGTVISARAVGDDVHFRHNTTVGVARRDAPTDDKPIIGNRVDVGVGAVIVGPITIADDTQIGANAVVLRSNGRNERTLVGIPARALDGDKSNGKR